MALGETTIEMVLRKCPVMNVITDTDSWSFEFYQVTGVYKTAVGGDLSLHLVVKTTGPRKGQMTLLWKSPRHVWYTFKMELSCCGQWSVLRTSYIEMIQPCWLEPDEMSEVLDNIFMGPNPL